MPLGATWMDLEIIIIRELTQKNKDKYNMKSLICRIKNVIQMDLFMKRKQTHRHRKENWLPKVGCVLISQSCPSLCDPIDYSPPGSSAHGLFQARTLEWVDISFSKEGSGGGILWGNGIISYILLPMK